MTLSFNTLFVLHQIVRQSLSVIEKLLYLYELLDVFVLLMMTGIAIATGIMCTTLHS